MDRYYSSNLPTELNEGKITGTLKVYAEEYAKTGDGAWLNDFDWASIPVALKRFNSDVCGEYTFGTIFLMECAVPSAIFEIYVHELRHAWQRNRNILLYYIGKIYRPLIENRAYEEQDRAGKWLSTRNDLVVREEAVKKA